MEKTKESSFWKKHLPSAVKEVEYFQCDDCINHRCGLFKPCSSLQFKVHDKSMIWHDKRLLIVIAKNVIYILMCKTWEWFYLGKTSNLKQRVRKQKSDVFHPQNSFCKNCAENLRNCGKMKEPFFRTYPFLYENIKRKMFHYMMETRNKLLSINC